MAIENADGNYYRIKSIVVTDNGSYKAELEMSKDQATRTTPTAFDSQRELWVHGSLSEEDVNALITKIYTDIKTQDDYVDFTDNI